MKKSMSLSARIELLNSMRERYREISWQEKRKLVDGFMLSTGYSRKYAITQLNRTQVRSLSSKSRQSHKQYDEAVRQALTTLWYAANQICSKRLVPFLPELVPILEQRGYLQLPTPIREQLLNISASTVDRLLKKERRRSRKSVSTTRAGNLLKRQIPIRTFADWNENVPGFMEIDLVAHCGGNVSRAYLNTLVLTDIATGWIECIPLLNKSGANVISALRLAKALLPFPLLGIDSDNGTEFINYDLLNFCKEEKITFTRSRSYKKNDQAHVEQKNGSVVRRLVGYDRFEGYEAWQALSKLYRVLRLYVNYFQPSLKLIFKERRGARVTKKYDKAQTPYQRTLGSASLTGKKEGLLTLYYRGLDPVDLLKSMELQQDKLWEYGFIALPVNAAASPQSLIPKQDLSVGNDQNRKKGKLLPAKVDSCDRFYRSSKNTKRPRSLRTRRTREDPFASAWDEIQRRLEMNPLLTATQILSDLRLQNPEQFKQSLCRTLQRRVKTWREEQHHLESILRQLLLPDSIQSETSDPKLPSKNELEVVRF